MEVSRGGDKTQRIQNGDEEPILADLGSEEWIELDIVKKFRAVT